MSRRTIISDEDLLKGAQAIAADMKLSDGGRIKLARIIDDHLDWFERARSRGLEWSDIVALMARAGATRGDGRPLSRGHVSSLVWRKQQGLNPKTPLPIAKPPEPTITTSVKKGSKRTSWLSGIDLPAADCDGSPATLSAKPSRRRSHQRAADAAVPVTQESTSGLELPTTDGNQTLAFMRRAARLRRDD